MALEHPAPVDPAELRRPAPETNSHCHRYAGLFLLKHAPPVIINPDDSR